MNLHVWESAALRRYANGLAIAAAKDKDQAIELLADIYRKEYKKDYHFLKEGELDAAVESFVKELTENDPSVFSLPVGILVWGSE